MNNPAMAADLASQTVPERWSDEHFSPYQSQGDRIADGVIQELLASGQIDGIHSVLDSIQRNDDPVSECPAVLRNYFEETAVLPSFANPDALRAAQDVFARYGLPMTLSLFCLVLPEGYAAPRPALALSFTRTMYDHTRRRIAETAQFLLDIVSPDAFGPEGRAIRSIQKVRLMHAAARFFVKRRPEWPEEYGDPISQEDLAAVAGGFGSETIRGLEKLGINLNESDREAYTHCWAVMSSMIGLDTELVARDFQDMDECVQSYKRRQWGPSKEGKELTASLMNMVNRQLPPLLRGLPQAYLYYLMGPEGAEILGVRKNLQSRLLRPFIGLNSFINLSQHKSRRLARMIRSVTLGILQGVMVREIGDRPVKFYMQPAIRKAWQMEPVYRRVSRKSNLSFLQVNLQPNSNESVSESVLSQASTSYDQDCTIIDLSRTGACIRLSGEFPISGPGSSVWLQIRSNDTILKIRAISCHVHQNQADGSKNIGFEFESPDRRTVRTIQDWLDKQ